MTFVLPEKTQRLVNMARHARGSRETARLSMDCFDLTSLNGNETKEDVLELCDIAKHNGLKSVFIYPDQIENASAALRSHSVVIGTPINFPFGERTLSGGVATPQTIRSDVESALKKGARQIDIVFPLKAFMDGNILDVRNQLRACRQACGKDVTMKVIFETAAFNDSEELRSACRIAIREKVDCLKTSTGKHPKGGATLEAAAILMDEASKAPHMVGCKVSGGVRTNDDCAKYITLARGIRGADSIRPEFFRIGASSLLDDLVQTLGRAPKGDQQGAPAYVY